MTENSASARSRIYAQLAQGFWWPTDEDDRREYDRLFSHRTNILCPIYEAEYDKHRAVGQGATLADIAGFYRAFGLELAVPERLDHLALELEFMSVLTYKEALALQNDLSERVELCRDAQQKFLEAHLGRWVEIFAQQIVRHSRSDVYSLLGHSLKEFIAAECQTLGARPDLIQERGDEPEAKLQCPVASQAG